MTAALVTSNLISSGLNPPYGPVSSFRASSGWALRTSYSCSGLREMVT